MKPDGIPEFLRIPQEERRAAWEKTRVAAKPAHVMPPEPTYKRITDIPGAAPDDGDT